MKTLPERINPLQYDLARQLQACQSTKRRNGKVARLPAELRDQINCMMANGIHYRAIIQSLGEAGKGLNEDNLTNWRKGGYQDYLNAQLLQQRARAQAEAAAGAVGAVGDLDASTLERACNTLALLHYFQALKHHGGRIAQESLKKNPAKMLTLMNTICNVSHNALTIQRNRDKTKALEDLLILRGDPRSSEP